MENKTTETALVAIANESVTIPAAVQPILGKNNALVKAKNFIAVRGGLTAESVKGMKLSDVKAKVGKDKAKLFLAEYNTAKSHFHVWSAKVNALAAADPTMRKSVKVVVGTKGNVLGIDTKARFMATDSATSTVLAENAELKVRLAAAEAKLLAAPAQA